MSFPLESIWDQERMWVLSDSIGKDIQPIKSSLIISEDSMFDAQS